MTVQVRSNEKPQPQASPESNSGGSKVIDEKIDKVEQKVDETQESEPLEKAIEQKEASESETEETESKEEGTAEGEEQKTHKKKGGFQRRIDKLSARNSQIEQEMEYWKQQALKGAGGATTSNPNNQTKNLPFVPGTNKPVADNFETHSEYVEALADWKMEQKLKERDQKLEQEKLAKSQSELVNSYNEKKKSFMANTPDFQEVIDDVGDVPISATLQDILLSSDNGPQLAYELAKNPEDFKRIANLPPSACAREIGRFEARLTVPSQKQVEAKKITNAPRPLQPVGTGGKGTSPRSIFDSSISQREYEALRRAEIKKRRQA